MYEDWKTVYKDKTIVVLVDDVDTYYLSVIPNQTMIRMEKGRWMLFKDSMRKYLHVQRDD